MDQGAETATLGGEWDWDSRSLSTGWSATGDTSTTWIVKHTSSKPDITSVSNASASEGDTLTFTVQLSGRTGQTETYYYSTYYGGGATASRSDYNGADEESVRVRAGAEQFYGSDQYRRRLKGRAG